jgi:hypothetical protein
VFEEIKVKYGERKIPEKILKLVEDKAMKASRSAAAAPVATTRIESKKWKDGDEPKDVAKKRKVAKVAIDLVEEVAESGQGGPEVARPTDIAVQAPASSNCPDEDLMGSSVRATMAVGAETVVVNLLPCILGDESS